MGKIYASADWHGSKIGYQILDFLKEDDTLYFLGDAIDREEYGADLMKRLLNDKRVIYLMGNHEEFFTHCMLDIYDTDKLDGMSGVWYYTNGGEYTVDAFLNNNYTRKQLENLIIKIQHLPLEEKYVNKKGDVIILEHAGYTPGIKRNHDPLWDRDHFHDKWDYAPHTYIVHGHTPVQYLKWHYNYVDKPKMTKEEIQWKYEFFHEEPTDYKPTILKYCGGHKICIDLCTIASNRIALLDLDTFEAIYFDAD